MKETTLKRQASSDSSAAKLERLQLQLDGANTKISELTRANSDLKQSNTEMQRQIEKWESLETKGASELDVLRKQRMDLEIEVVSLRNQVEKKDDEKESVMKKLNTRIERYRETVEEWKVHLV
jgi:chromosome segregation ATPase